MDLQGDVSGFLEGEVPKHLPVASLHHMGSWASGISRVSPHLGALHIARAAYDMPQSACMFRRAVLQPEVGNATYVLTAGYSLQVSVSVQRLSDTCQLSNPLLIRAPTCCKGHGSLC